MRERKWGHLICKDNEDREERGGIRFSAPQTYATNGVSEYEGCLADIETLIVVIG